MIEAYAFLVAFSVQIFAMSVLYPTWFIGRARQQANAVAMERVAQLYPTVDLDVARERFLSRYRLFNNVIAGLGLLLLGWFFGDVRQPGWDHDGAGHLSGVYFLVQALPLFVIAVLAGRSNKVLRQSLREPKRKALLQRRGLFDFVSPLLVCLAVLGYFLCAAFVLYVDQHPFAGFAGATRKIIGITAVYVLNAFIVYRMLYGKRINALETHETRAYSISVTVKVGVYMCIAVVVFVPLDLVLALLDLRQWEPAALSAFFVATTLLCLAGMAAPARGSDEPLASGA